MLRDEIRQVERDFNLAPRVVDEWVEHTPKEDALRAVRQVTTVTHYLSRMSVGEAMIDRGVAYGAAIVCIDELTDELGVKLTGNIAPAFDGAVRHDSLSILQKVSGLAANPGGFEEHVRWIGEWQDISLRQFEDNISVGEVAEITRNKGGHSAVANLYLVKETVSGEEEKLMRQFGWTMQLLDDYLDQPEDEENGVSTMFTEGQYDADDLLGEIRVTEEMLKAVWGESTALSRFSKIMRLHRRLGQLANAGYNPRNICPWYV